MIKTTIIVLMAIISALFLGSSHAEIYNWIDNTGNVHFSDKPSTSKNSEKVEVNVIPPSMPAPGSIQSKPNTFSDSTSKPNDKKEANKKVAMYSTAWCPYCKKARNYFKKESISFTEYDVEKLPSRMREFHKLGGTGYPLILIGDKNKMHGFSVKGFEKRYNKL